MALDKSDFLVKSGPVKEVTKTAVGGFVQYLRGRLTLGEEDGLWTVVSNRVARFLTRFPIWVWVGDDDIVRNILG